MDASDFDDIRKAVRSFVRDEVVPAEDEIEETDAIPEQYGGLGMNASEDVRLAMEFGYTTPSFRSEFGTSNGVAGQVLVHSGTDERKQEFLPGIASGDCISSFALTESEAGSDPSGLKTRADRDGDDDVINGQKRYITNAAWPKLLMVSARTGGDGAAGISVFPVDTAAPGVTVGPRDKKRGQRGSATSEIYFDNVRVPADRLVGGVEGVGFKAAMKSLSKRRLHIAACCVGMADRRVDESVGYAASAKQAGTIIGQFQQVQALIADSTTDYLAGRALVLATAATYDDGSDRNLAPSAAKLFCSEMVGRVADRAVQIHGGAGYMHGVAVERFYRDDRIYEGTSEVQKVVIVKQMLRRATSTEVSVRL